MAAMDGHGMEIDVVIVCSKPRFLLPLEPALALSPFSSLFPLPAQPRKGNISHYTENKNMGRKFEGFGDES